MVNMIKCHHCQVTNIYGRHIFLVTSEFFVQNYIMELQTTLNIGSTDQPKYDGLIEQMFKLMRKCVELIGTIASYYEVFSTHT